jgi:hypothetical protein
MLDPLLLHAAVMAAMISHVSLAPMMQPAAALHFD